MSLKDEITESLENFTVPMKQAINNMGNIGENMSDAIADMRDEMKDGSEDEGDSAANAQQNGGCLKRLLVYGFVIIAILAFFKNGCSFNGSIERDSANAETGHTQVTELNDNKRLYDICIRATEKNIEELVAQEPLDAEALEDEFEFLLTCYASEYMFKSMAYGHFTGEYEPTQYDYIAEKSNEVAEQMKKYVDEEIVDEIYVGVSLKAYETFDDTMFDYDSCLIGTTQAPDIDAMWYECFASLATEG